MYDNPNWNMLYRNESDVCVGLFLQLQYHLPLRFKNTIVSVMGGGYFNFPFEVFFHDRMRSQF